MTRWADVLRVGGLSAGVLIVLSAVGSLLAPTSPWRPERYAAPPLEAARSGTDPRGASPPTTTYPIHQDQLVVTGSSGVRAATVVAPIGDGPFPAVVLVHGGGPGRGSDLLDNARTLARSGIVAAVYDKRADYSIRSRDIDLLADDALAVLRTTQKLSHVDAARVGLWGISEGGRVVARAAARSPQPRS